MPGSSSAVSTLGKKIIVLIAVKSPSTPGTAVPVCGVLTAAIPREGTRRVATDRNEKCPSNPRSVEWSGTSLRPRRSPPGASNALIDEALRYDCDVIAFENLTHIRDRTGASWGHKWAFRTLCEYVEYKAESVGISVKQVGSAYTSKRCAECGFTADENRLSRNDFQCVKCGLQANADYDAAKNIGMRYVRRGQQSSRRTGDSQLALKFGTVKPNRGFTAYPDGFEAEFTDKLHPQSAEGA